MGFIRYVLIGFLLSLHVCACKNQGSSTKQDTVSVHSQTKFPFPKIPATLTEAEARKAFLLTHYWDQFDFTDTTLVNNRDVTEQGFVNFIALLADGTTPEELTRESLGRY